MLNMLFAPCVCVLLYLIKIKSRSTLPHLGCLKPGVPSVLYCFRPHHIVGMESKVFVSPHPFLRLSKGEKITQQEHTVSPLTGQRQEINFLHFGREPSSSRSTVLATRWEFKWFFMKSFSGQETGVLFGLLVAGWKGSTEQKKTHKQDAFLLNHLSFERSYSQRWTFSGG